MNISRTLASAVAAAAVMGSIGIAYAQTTSDPISTPLQTQSMDPNNRSLSSPATTSSDPTMRSSETGNPTLSNELAPQADRG